MLASLLMGLELLIIYLIKYGLLLIPLYFVVKFAMIAALRKVQDEDEMDLHEASGDFNNELEDANDGCNG